MLKSKILAAKNRDKKLVAYYKSPVLSANTGLKTLAFIFQAQIGNSNCNIQAFLALKGNWLQGNSFP